MSCKIICNGYKQVKVQFIYLIHNWIREKNRVRVNVANLVVNAWTGLVFWNYTTQVE
jgi:hypothetical protein